MKNFKTLIFAIIFSTLFYKKSIGINLSLFTLLTITSIIITNFKAFKNRIVLLKALIYIVSGITIFFFKSNLTITTNILAFITFIGSVSESKSSIYVKWINGTYTSIVSFFSKYYDNLNAEVEKIEKEEINYVYWLKIISIPIIVIAIFIKLYRMANPTFDDLFSKIDLSFINFYWLLFTCLGYYLFYNITNPIQIEPITSNDINTGNSLEKDTLKHNNQKKLKEEKQLGNVLMLLLNILILFFLATYIIHLSEIHKMIAPELSKQVHNGVNALIFSNVLAIVIILYFFRGNLNFFNKNKELKSLTFLWIFLNLCVVIVTVIINFEYIVSFGLTYKRIGVLFFLIIVTTGLVTTYIKVSKIKNLWYLFRKNTQIAFAFLVLSSTINWDKVITYYNINNAHQLDLNYLINLSDNNAFMLKDYAEKNEISISEKLKISSKHRDYLDYLHNNSWQEITFDNIKIKK